MTLNALLFVRFASTPDRAAEDQPEVRAGPVERVQARVRGDQRVPDGGPVLRVPLPPPHRIPGGRQGAGGEPAGTEPGPVLTIFDSYENLSPNNNKSPVQCK